MLGPAKILAALFHYDDGAMATCPRCGAFLNEGHQCSHPWRRRLRLGARIAMAMAVGGFISVSLLFTVVGTTTSAAVAMAALLGVIVGEAVRQAIPRH
jgi:uncharacterized paraquat-inducible protein A